MKKIIVTGLTFILMLNVFAQYEKDKDETKGKGFKKENLFTGGSVTASFYSGGTVLGVSPSFGYSINKIVDAGIALNFTYTGERAYSGDKYREYVYGPGVFVRIFPINMIFVQATFEHNFISQTLKPAYGGPDQKFKADANSFLVGGGYASGREGVGTTFFYLSVLVDLIKDPNSPYVELLQNGSYRSVPIIRAGLQIPLFQGNSRRRN
jgi:hypothetical protein